MEIINYNFLCWVMWVIEGKAFGEGKYIMSANRKRKLPCFKEQKVDLWLNKKDWEDDSNTPIKMHGSENEEKFSIKARKWMLRDKEQ